MGVTELPVAADPALEPWLELKVTCDATETDTVADLFASYDLPPVEVFAEEMLPDSEDSVAAPRHQLTVRTMLPISDQSPERLRELRDTLWLVRQRLWVLSRTQPIGALRVIERQTADWAAAWKDKHSVYQVGDQVFVKAPWHDRVPQPGETVIELDPGRGFGNGHFPATQLSMRALEKAVVGGERVLDVGVGAGTLAIAAAKLGARHVDAVDIDPAAVDAARANAARNGLADIVRVEVGSVGPGEPFQDDYDLVVANITGPVVIPLAPWLVRATKPGGILILGGVFFDQENSVLSAYAGQPLLFVDRRQLEDWVAIVWRRAV